METKLPGELGAHQVPNPIDSLNDGVVEVVDDGDGESLVEELNHRVAADEARPAGD